MSNFEYAFLIAARASHLSSSEIDKDYKSKLTRSNDPLDIAEAELFRPEFPFKLERKLPNGTSIIVHPSELLKPKICELVRTEYSWFDVDIDYNDIEETESFKRELHNYGFPIILKEENELRWYNEKSYTIDELYDCIDELVESEKNINYKNIRGVMKPVNSDTGEALLSCLKTGEWKRDDFKFVESGLSPDEVFVRNLMIEDYVGSDKHKRSKFVFN